MLATLAQGPILIVVLSATGLGSQRPIALTGNSPQERFGWSLAQMGDIDGDGIGDFAVGAPWHRTTVPGAGRVRVLSGATLDEIYSVHGDTMWGLFGVSIDSLGDVDGDGVRDLIVGAVGEAVLGAATGRAHVISGATGVRIRALEGQGAASSFGFNVASAGDLNSDGVDDMLVGASRSSVGGTNSGQVRLYSGADGSLLREWTGQAGQFLGWRTGSVGDVDGDGVREVFIGSVESQATKRISLYSGATGVLVRSHSSTLPFDGLGAAVLDIGDHDGDGRADYLIGAPSDSSVASSAGRVTLHSGATGAEIRSYFGPRMDSGFGASLASIGDLDGDQREDFCIGMPGDSSSGEFGGAIRVISSATGAILLERAIAIENDQFGKAVEAIGDLNGDGVVEFLVGSPGNSQAGSDAGAVYMFVSVGGIGSSPCASTANSTGNAASTVAVGSVIAGHGLLELLTADVPAGALGIYIVSRTPGFTPHPGGSQGNLCLAGMIGRYTGPGQLRVADANGTFSLDLDLMEIPQPTGAAAVAAGSTWYWQAWFRDSVAGLATSNLSSSVSVMFR